MTALSDQTAPSGNTAPSDDHDAAVGRILLTGAAGQVATLLRPRLARPGRVLRLLDVVAPAPLITGAGETGEEVFIGSVTDAAAMDRACAGVTAIVHLAGIAGEAPWSELLSVNVDGTRTVLEAAVRHGINRVILASSNHAAGFYGRADGTIAAVAAPRPDTYYGFTKAAMESLGSLYADRFGMTIAAARIGTCALLPTNARALATWLSPDDAARLVEACLSAPRFGFRILWGISANTRRWWSLGEGAELGYYPVDDAEAYAARLLAEQGEPDLSAPDHDLVGGPFCAMPLGQRR